MNPTWQHQKIANTTDQKFLTDDEHIREEEKQELKSDDRPENKIPGSEKAARQETERDLKE